MPIACVDLLVVNAAKEVLMVKRNNQPAMGEWWFPGGRIWFGETRVEAAVRKLKEECGLRAVKIDYVGTYDLMLERSDDGTISHAITSMYRMLVEEIDAIRLDSQSQDARWLIMDKWLTLPLHSFVKERLSACARNDSYADGLPKA